MLSTTSSLFPIITQKLSLMVLAVYSGELKKSLRRWLHEQYFFSFPLNFHLFAGTARIVKGIELKKNLSWLLMDSPFIDVVVNSPLEYGSLIAQSQGLMPLWGRGWWEDDSSFCCSEFGSFICDSLKRVYLLSMKFLLLMNYLTFVYLCSFRTVIT